MLRLDLPIVAAAANPLTVCAGQLVTLTATGASTYSWAYAYQFRNQNRNR